MVSRKARDDLFIPGDLTPALRSSRASTPLSWTLLDAHSEP